MDTTAVQRALVALGYSLVVDGKAGPKTKAGLSRRRSRVRAPSSAPFFPR